MPSGRGAATVRRMHVMWTHVAPRRRRGLGHMAVPAIGMRMRVVRVVLLEVMWLLLMMVARLLLRLLGRLGLMTMVLRGVVGRGTDGRSGRHLALRCGGTGMAVKASHGRVIRRRRARAQWLTR